MIRRLALRLLGDKRGVSVVEFGLMVIPFTLVMVGLLDLSYQMYVQSVLQGATNDAARIITVESPNLPGTGPLQDRMKQVVMSRMQSIDLSGAVYTVTADTYNRYGDYGSPERLTNDKNKNGRYDVGDCWFDTNPNGVYDTTNSGTSGVGGADDVVRFTVNLKMPRLVPVGALWGDTNQLDMNVTTAIKRQPYRDQSSPQERCS